MCAGSVSENREMEAEMERTNLGWLTRLAVVGLLATLPGCAAAAAGAGAAGAIAYTQRGASSLVNASPSAVADVTEAVFAEMGITLTEREVDGGDFEIEGEDGDIEIDVSIEAEGDGMTEIEVIAQESMVEWNRDYARDVLRRIIERL